MYFSGGHMYRTEPLGTGWGQTVYDGTLLAGP